MLSSKRYEEDKSYYAMRDIISQENILFPIYPPPPTVYSHSGLKGFATEEVWEHDVQVGQEFGRGNAE